MIKFDTDVIFVRLPSFNKTEQHDMTEILLNVELNTHHHETRKIKLDISCRDICSVMDIYDLYE